MTNRLDAARSDAARTRKRAIKSSIRWFGMEDDKIVSNKGREKRENSKSGDSRLAAETGWETFGGGGWAGSGMASWVCLCFARGVSSLSCPIRRVAGKLPRVELASGPKTGGVLKTEGCVTQDICSGRCWVRTVAGCGS